MSIFNKLFLISISCVVVSACSGPSGKGGMPVTLEEHAQLACDESWAAVDQAIKDAKGQEKDLLKADADRYSKSDICKCTVKTAQIGIYKYDDRVFNEFIAADTASGELKNVYDSFKKYTYDEVLPIVKTKYDLYEGDIKMAFVVCAEGFDPDKYLADQRAEEYKNKAAQENAQQETTEGQQAAPQQAVVSEPTPSPDAVVQQPPTQQAQQQPSESAGAFAPSFDCAKASSGQDRLVCGSRKLSQMDVELSTLYSKARSVSADKNALKQTQLNWYKFQRNACSDESCLEMAYESRIIELSEEVSGL